MEKFTLEQEEEMCLSPYNIYSAILGACKTAFVSLPSPHYCDKRFKHKNMGAFRNKNHELEILRFKEYTVKEGVIDIPYFVKEETSQEELSYLEKLLEKKNIKF